MNSHKRGLSICLLSGFLFLCLACLEIPEMSTLTDDVSNDFTILTTASETSDAVTQAKIEDARQVVEQSLAVVQSLARPFIQDGSDLDSDLRDLLALYSLRRT